MQPENRNNATLQPENRNRLTSLCNLFIISKDIAKTKKRNSKNGTFFRDLSDGARQETETSELASEFID